MLGVYIKLPPHMTSKMSYRNYFRCVDRSHFHHHHGHPRLCVIEVKRHRRIKKWNRMLSLSTSLIDQKKFISRLAKGIPDVHRPSAWKLLLSNYNFSHFQSISINTLDFPIGKVIDLSYYNSIYKLSSEYERQIDLDISRTLRTNLLFKERYGFGQSFLFKILVSLANALPFVGYCQGMSTVCGFLLSYLQDDHITFNSILYLFGRDSLACLYSSGFPKLFETFFLHDKLFRELIPTLWKHFVSFLHHLFLE